MKILYPGKEGTDPAKFSLTQVFLRRGDTAHTVRWLSTNKGVCTKVNHEIALAKTVEMTDDLDPILDALANDQDQDAPSDSNTQELPCMHPLTRAYRFTGLAMMCILAFGMTLKNFSINDHRPVRLLLLLRQSGSVAKPLHERSEALVRSIQRVVLGVCVAECGFAVHRRFASRPHPRHTSGINSIRNARHDWTGK